MNINAFFVIFAVLLGVAGWNVFKGYRRRSAVLTAAARKEAEEKLGPMLVVEALAAALAEGRLTVEGAARAVTALPLRDRAVGQEIVEVLRLTLAARGKERTAEADPGNPLFRIQAEQTGALALQAARKAMQAAAQSAGLAHDAYKEQALRVLALAENLQQPLDSGQPIDGILS